MNESQQSQILNQSKENQKIEFLECEKKSTFLLLMTAAGFLGAFTYSIRGGIFCNAQTGNLVLLAMALGNQKWLTALYLIIPISAYLAGSIISEALPTHINQMHVFRWDTVLVGFEILVIIMLGFLPESAPHQISQVAVNFICSMQYNTFRQAQKIPMATVFCTNHIRQLGINIVKWAQNKNSANASNAQLHFFMLLTFVFGGIVSTVLCKIFLGKAIWGAAAILLIVFIDLLHADLTREKNLLDRKPSGH